MAGFNRRDVMKQGLAAFLSPKQAIGAVNSAIASIPKVGRLSLEKLGVDIYEFLSVVLDGEEAGGMLAGEDYSVVLDNGKEIPADKVAALIKNSLAGVDLGELIELSSAYMSSADYDGEFGVFSGVIDAAIDRVGLKNFVRAVIAYDGDRHNGVPSIDDSRLEVLQDVLNTVTNSKHLSVLWRDMPHPDMDFEGAIGYLKSNGFIKPVEAAKMLRSHGEAKARFDERVRNHESQMVSRDKGPEQSDPDWYHDSPDPFSKTKERFYESRIRRVHCFTEGYRSLVEAKTSYFGG